MHLRLAFAIMLALVAAQATGARRSAQPGFAEPGDIIAAESNFARLSADKGIKAAIRATATPNAQRMMLNKEFANSADSNLVVPWHTHELWMSCDGSFAVTHGEWKLSRATGWYVTIWQRQKGGGYKWVLVEGGLLQAPLPESDMIAASVADCPARRAPASSNLAKGKAPDHGIALVADYTSGHADDGTLTWATTLAADGSRSFVLQVKQDGALHEVLRAAAAPPGA